MFDHVTIQVTDLKKSTAFYEQALAPLGSTILFREEHSHVGFGKERPQFWLSQADKEDRRGISTHIAFFATTREMVDAFHRAAIAAGATDNGKPGPRQQYHEDYYGAFVLDPDGNNVEAVYGNE